MAALWDCGEMSVIDLISNMSETYDGSCKSNFTRLVFVVGCKMGKVVDLSRQMESPQS